MLTTLAVGTWLVGVAVWVRYLARLGVVALHQQLGELGRDLAAGTAVDGTPSRPGGRGREGASEIGWPGASATARPGEGM